MENAGQAAVFALNDQVAVVTGAAMGLGEGIARRLAQAGATVRNSA